MLFVPTGHATSQKYYGKKLGSFKTLEHGVSGDIYAVDSRTLHLRNLNYDGQGPGEWNVEWSVECGVWSGVLAGIGPGPPGIGRRSSG